MEDTQIVDLFWQRKEDAIFETAQKYEKLCYRIAYNILRNHEDSVECVNSAYLQTWNTIPPHWPEALPAFLGKITRNLALNQYEHDHAQKRYSGQVSLSLDELSECIAASSSRSTDIADDVLRSTLNAFLRKLTPGKRKIFVSRYYGFMSVSEIASAMNISESNIRVTLYRTRKQLKKYLLKEGVLV